MKDAGMPMPALVFWMPMPTYADYHEDVTEYGNFGKHWNFFFTLAAVKVN
jgi:hypothetical protein